MRERLRPFALPIVFSLTLLPLCTLGYGSDNDTFTVLDAGRSTWLHHWPDTSRNPGYWTFEAIVFVLQSVGGFLATNIASLLIGAILLWRFLVLAGRLGVRYPVLVAASLAATPVYVIASTSTDDYLWSLLGLVLFVELLMSGTLALSILPAAFAFAIRGANGPLLAGAILGAIYHDRKRAVPLLGVGVAAAMLGGVPYLASYHLAGNSLSFLHAAAGPDAMWTATMRIGRFFYKSTFLFGPIATGVLLLGLSGNVKRSDRRSSISIFVGVIAANVLLFLAYPIEISYLLPAAFFLLLLAGTSVLAKSRWLTTGFLIASASLNLVVPQLAAPDAPGHATSARLHPAIQPGVLVDDIRLRLALRSCADYRCYYLHFHPAGEGLRYVGPPISAR